MLPHLIVIIVLPVIMGIVTVTPLEPPEEQIQEPLADESPDSGKGIIIIMLAIIWTFFIVRMLKVLYVTRMKSRVRK